jgi:hypothetical protein
MATTLSSPSHPMRWRIPRVRRRTGGRSPAGAGSELQSPVAHPPQPSPSPGGGGQTGLSLENWTSLRHDPRKCAPLLHPLDDGFNAAPQDSVLAVLGRYLQSGLRLGRGSSRLDGRQPTSPPGSGSAPRRRSAPGTRAMAPRNPRRGYRRGRSSASASSPGVRSARRAARRRAGGARWGRRGLAPGLRDTPAQWLGSSPQPTTCTEALQSPCVTSRIILDSSSSLE